MTDSKFLPLLHREKFHELHNAFTEWNDNQPLTENRASSKKMKRQTKMISIIRNSLQDKDKLTKHAELQELKKKFNSIENVPYKKK